MRTGDADGLGFVYDKNGELILRDFEKVLAKEEGIIPQIKTTWGFFGGESQMEVTVGVAYLTNLRFVYINEAEGLSATGMGEMGSVQQMMSHKVKMPKGMELQRIDTQKVDIHEYLEVPIKEVVAAEFREGLTSAGVHVNMYILSKGEQSHITFARDPESSLIKRLRQKAAKDSGEVTRNLDEFYENTTWMLLTDEEKAEHARYIKVVEDKKNEAEREKVKDELAGTLDEVRTGMEGLRAQNLDVLELEIGLKQVEMDLESVELLSATVKARELREFLDIFVETVQNGPAQLQTYQQQVWSLKSGGKNTTAAEGYLMQAQALLQAGDTATCAKTLRAVSEEVRKLTTVKKRIIRGPKQPVSQPPGEAAAHMQAQAQQQQMVAPGQQPAQQMQAPTQQQMMQAAQQPPQQMDPAQQQMVAPAQQPAQQMQAPAQQQMMATAQQPAQQPPQQVDPAQQQQMAPAQQPAQQPPQQVDPAQQQMMAPAQQPAQQMQAPAQQQMMAPAQQPAQQMQAPAQQQMMAPAQQPAQQQPPAQQQMMQAAQQPPQQMDPAQQQMMATAQQPAQQPPQQMDPAQQQMMAPAQQPPQQQAPQMDPAQQQMMATAQQPAQQPSQQVDPAQQQQMMAPAQQPAQQPPQQVDPAQQQMMATAQQPQQQQMATAQQPQQQVVVKPPPSATSPQDEIDDLFGPPTPQEAQQKKAKDEIDDLFG